MMLLQKLKMYRDKKNSSKKGDVNMKKKSSLSRVMMTGGGNLSKKETRRLKDVMKK